MAPADLETLIAIAVLSVAGMACVLTLRMAHIAGGRPAAAVCGGLVAGVLLGPLVLGNTYPELYARVAVGAVAQRAELNAMDRRHGADKLALSATGVSPEALKDLEARHADEREPLEAAVHDASVRHMRATALGPMTLGVLGVLLAWATAPNVMTRHLSPKQGTGVMAAGVMWVAVAGGTTAVLSQWLLGVDRATSAILGAVVGTGSALGVMPMRWLPLSGRSAHIGRIGIAATLLSVVALGVLDQSLIVWTTPIVLAALLGISMGRGVRVGRGGRSIARFIVLWLATPTSIAWLVSRVDPTVIAWSWREVLFVGIALLAAGDGHIGGAWLGWKSLGTAEDSELALERGVECTGSGLVSTQMLLMIPVVAMGVIDLDKSAGIAAVISLVVAGVMIEVLAPMNRQVAKWQESA